MASSRINQSLFSDYGQQFDSAVFVNTVISQTCLGASVIQSNLDATTYDGLTGSIRSLGGLSIAKTAYINKLNVSGNSTFLNGVNITNGLSTDVITSNSGTVSQLSTSSLTVLTAININNTSDLTSLVLQGGATVKKTLNANNITVTNTVTSTSVTSGNLSVTGSSTLVSATLSGVLSSTNTSDATSTTSTTCSINTPGGLAVGQSLFTRNLTCANQFTASSGTFNGLLNATAGIQASNITLNGNLLVNSSGSSTFNGKIIGNDTTDASVGSPSAAFYLPNGGMYVGLSIVGKNLIAQTNITTSTLNTSGLYTATAGIQTNTINATNTSFFSALQVTGSVDAVSSTTSNAALYVQNGGIACNNTIFGKVVSSTTSMNAQTASFQTSVSTGTMNSSTIVNSGNISNTGTNNATSSNTPTASIYTKGGISCNQDIYCASINATSSSVTSTFTGPVVFNGAVTYSGTTVNNSAYRITNTVDATSTTSTTAALQVLGGIACAGSTYSVLFGIGNLITLASAQLTTTTPNTNALRIRSNDATNSTIGLSLANSGPTSYYESQIALFNLGSTNTSANSERLALGINSSGGYLNYLVAGTGTSRPFNLFNGSLFSNGGSLSLATNLSITNTQDAVSTTMTTAPLYVAGGAAISGSLFANVVNVTNLIAFTGATASVPVSQGGTALNTNALRIRNNDTTNTATAVILSNAAMGNSYYDSHIGFYNLGSSNTSTNLERMLIGINGSGGYLNYMFSGTGTARPFNLLNGAVFTTGGQLTLANNLNVSSTVDVQTSNPANTSIYTAGGLYVTKQINAQGGFINSNMMYLNAYATSSQTISARSSTSMACNLAAINIGGMSGVLTASSSSPNTFTVPVSGLWNFKASIRVTPNAAGTVELYALANSSSTLWPSPTNRYDHSQMYVSTNTQVVISVSGNAIPLNQGDTITFVFYFTPGALSNATLVLNAANDTILSFSLTQRSA